MNVGCQELSYFQDIDTISDACIPREGFCATDTAPGRYDHGPQIFIQVIATFPNEGFRGGRGDVNGSVADQKIAFPSAWGVSYRKTVMLNFYVRHGNLQLGPYEVLHNRARCHLARRLVLPFKGRINEIGDHVLQ